MRGDVFDPAIIATTANKKRKVPESTFHRRERSLFSFEDIQFVLIGNKEVSF